MREIPASQHKAVFIFIFHTSICGSVSDVCSSEELFSNHSQSNWNNRGFKGLAVTGHVSVYGSSMLHLYAQTDVYICVLFVTRK